MLGPPKMTTRSQSRTQEAGTLGDVPETPPGPLREASVASEGQRQEFRGDSTPLGDNLSEIEESIEREKAESERLRTRIHEEREKKRGAIESRIAELEKEEARRAAYEAELEELLGTKGDRSATNHKRPGSPLGSGRGAPREAHREPDGRPPSPSPPHRTARDAPKFRDLPVYNGKTLREAQTFLDGAERRFRIDAGLRYRGDQSRIDYCVLAFGTAPAAKWERYERRRGVGTTTWEQFKEWMKDSIVDPANRAFDAVTSYNEARQRDGQSSEDFAAYLDSLEIELRIDDDWQRRNNLFAKLREELRKDILQRNDVPGTRQELLSLATRIETTHRMTGGGRSRKSVGTPPDPSRQDRRDTTKGQGRWDKPGPATGVNLTPTAPKPAPSSGQCPRCKSTTHRLPNCPEVTCYRCDKKGHIASACPMPAGNGGSRR